MSLSTPVRLFSYGTLRYEEVQLALFGRPLQGQADSMAGFTKGLLEISDPDVLATSGERFHTVAIPSDEPEQAVDGVVFAITEAELDAADTYETADYKRVMVTLRSGLDAWAYVRA